MLNWFLRALSLIILKLFFRFQAEGGENIPQKSNFIVVANHTSFLDAVAITAAIPKKIYWLASWKLYGIPWLKWIMSISKTMPTGNASERAAGLLIKNLNVGLFPEGTRSHDGNLKEFRRGAALLALKTGRPILPCAIFGAYEALPRQAKLPKFKRISIKIGKPVYLLKEFTDIIDDVRLQEGTFKIKNAVKELLNAK